MALWPFVPRDAYTETLDWLSDVIRTYSAEQRISLTSTPRQRLNFSHLLTARQYQRARLLMQGYAASDWTVPLWHENQTVTVGSGATSITIDTTTSDYRVGGSAVLWTDDETCESVTISAVTAGTLTVSATSRAYTSALCMPGITARCVDGLQADRSVESFVNASLEFLAYTGADLSGSGLYATSYRGHLVISDAAVLGDASMGEPIAWPQDVVDNDIAAGYHDTLQDMPVNTFVMAWLTETQSDLWALRRWLHYLKGRQVGFWIPAWTSGLSIQANITAAGTTITLLAVGLDGIIEAGDLMVRTTAGAQHFFRFTSVALSGSNEVLTLSAAAGVNITTTDIERCCLLHFCRLLSDSVDIEHRNPRQARVRVAVQEVPIP